MIDIPLNLLKRTRQKSRQERVYDKEDLYDTATMEEIKAEIANADYNIEVHVDPKQDPYNLLPATLDFLRYFSDRYREALLEYIKEYAQTHPHSASTLLALTEDKSLFSPTFSVYDQSRSAAKIQEMEDAYKENVQYRQNLDMRKRRRDNLALPDEDEDDAYKPSRNPFNSQAISAGELLVVFDLPKPLSQYWWKNRIPGVTTEWGGMYQALTEFMYELREDSDKFGFDLNRLNDNGVHVSLNFYYVWSAQPHK